MKLTNPDKVLYPATGTTKAQVFDYYVSIAEVMIPHIAGRPATRKRWPNGVDEASFFEKQLASSAPDWLDRASITHRSGTTTYPIIDTVEALAWIAQQAALEVHVPQWRFVAGGRSGVGEDAVHPGPATRLVFDLDPGEGVTMKQLCEVAQAVKELMGDIGLTTYPLTSGSKGLHLYAPLEHPVSSQGAVVLAKRVAQQLEKAMPKLVTSTMTKSVRAATVVSAVLAVVATWLGILLAYDSYYWDSSSQGLPVSFFVVTIVFAMYLISGVPALRRRVHSTSRVLVASDIERGRAPRKQK